MWPPGSGPCLRSPIRGGMANLWMEVRHITRQRLVHWEGKIERGGVPTGKSGRDSTVSFSVRQDQKQIKWCCSCTRHSTCFAKGPSDRACECRNAGQTYTRCMFLGKCRNRGRLLPSLTTAVGLFGHFMRSAVQPASSPTVRDTTHSSR